MSGRERDEERDFDEEREDRERAASSCTTFVRTAFIPNEDEQRTSEHHNKHTTQMYRHT